MNLRKLFIHALSMAALTCLGQQTLLAQQTTGELSTRLSTPVAQEPLRTEHASPPAQMTPASSVLTEEPVRGEQSTERSSATAPAFALKGREMQIRAAQLAGSDETQSETAGKSFIFDAAIRPLESQTPQNTGAATNVSPLTGSQKLKYGFKRAFLSPQGYVLTGISATLTQLREEDQPHKETDDKVADWLSRYAINFSTRATRTMLGSGVYPALFKQDPRYYPSEKRGFAARAAYAASRVFVTRGDNGDAQFNISRVAGTLSAAALANLWERDTPGHDRTGTPATFKRFGRSLAFDALSFVVFREFWPDIMGIFKR